MAPLKIPLHVSCPNCQTANLPGSPYCGRCGASLEGMTAGALATGQPPAAVGHAGDAMRQFTSDGQDYALVQLAHTRASEILTSGESLEYVAVATRGSLSHAPDCAVATNKRIILYRKKVLGKLEQDDYYWRDVRSASIKETRGGVTFTVETIQGWQMTIESLPKSQALRLHQIAIEHSEKLAEALLGKNSAIDLRSDFGNSQPAPAPYAELPHDTYAPVAPQPPHLPVRPAVSSLPTLPQPPAIPQQPVMVATEPVQPQPTPESVLQAILQQAVRDSGAPTRPMSLSAAAFQAPVADAQPVTFSEANADANMRSMPRLNNLEQIAVFTGPLTGGLRSAHDSVPLSPYEPRTVQSSNGASPQRSPGTHSNPEENFHREPAAEQPSEGHNAWRPASNGSKGQNESQFRDEALPLPGSLSSGPLLEAAFDNATTAYPEDLISGSLETQRLYAHRAAELSDRITSTNLASPQGDRSQAAGRARRSPGSGRVAAPTHKPGRQPAGGTQPVGHAEVDDPVQKMKQLKAMLDAGLIENADYEAKKAEILSRL